MSKILALTLATLLALPMIAGPALAAKNIGMRPIKIGAAVSDTACETIMVPQWSCPPGKSPGDFACTLILVEQKVCHAA